MLFIVDWTRKTNEWSALIASAVDIRLILALHSSSTSTGMVTDHVMMEKMEDAARDNNPHSSEYKEELDMDVTLQGFMLLRPLLETQSV